MPRAKKMRCAYAERDPVEKAKAAKEARAATKARQALLTPEEKEQKKDDALMRAAAREVKKFWEESLKEYQPADPDRGTSFPNGTKVMFKSDAKREFGLSDKDIASLPFQGFANSRKRVYSVEQLNALAKRKFLTTGIDYPKRVYPETLMKFVGMTKTSEKLTGLMGRGDSL